MFKLSSTAMPSNIGRRSERACNLRSVKESKKLRAFMARSQAGEGKAKLFPSKSGTGRKSAPSRDVAT